MIDKKENKILINIEFSSKEDHYKHDSEELEQATYSLRDDLIELDTIEKVELVKRGEQAPQGSKAGVGIAEWGSLIVTLATSAVSSVIPNIVSTLQSWLSSHDRRKISLEIGGDKLEVTGISDKEQQRLIDTWIMRHVEKEKNLDEK